MRYAYAILEPYAEGQIWERDGKRRQIVSIAHGDVKWMRPQSASKPRPAAVRTAFCSTWVERASKATLVEESR